MKQLAQLNRQGLFPAPGQADEAFWAKVDDVASSPLNRPPPSLLTGFDIAPSWVPLKEGNEGIRLWEGAALWQQETGRGFVLPLIQISPRGHRFCSRDELIAHESVHAVRADFKEEQFEEVLAYATSSKAWRRWLGPLFRNPREAIGFLWTVVGSVASQVFALAVESTSAWLIIPWLPLLFIFFALGRLWNTQQQFKRCRENLRLALKDPDQAMAVLLRLSDREIRSFSRMEPQRIREWVDTEQRENLRWQMIAQCYF